MRYTKKDVKELYEYIIKDLNLNANDCYMRTWSPGDGATRYEFMFQRSQMGNCVTLYGLGAHEAWKTLKAFQAGYAFVNGC